MCVIKSFLKLPTLSSLHHYTPLPPPNHTPTYIYVSLIDLIQSHIYHQPYIRPPEIHHGSNCKYILLGLTFIFFVCLCRKKHFYWLIIFQNIHYQQQQNEYQYVLSICIKPFFLIIFYQFLLPFTGYMHCELIGVDT